VSCCAPPVFLLHSELSQSRVSDEASRYCIANVAPTVQKAFFHRREAISLRTGQLSYHGMSFHLLAYGFPQENTHFESDFFFTSRLYQGNSSRPCILRHVSATVYTVELLSCIRLLFVCLVSRVQRSFFFNSERVSFNLHSLYSLLEIES